MHANDIRNGPKRCCYQGIFTEWVMCKCSKIDPSPEHGNTATRQHASWHFVTDSGENLVVAPGSLVPGLALAAPVMGFVIVTLTIRPTRLYPRVSGSLATKEQPSGER